MTGNLSSKVFYHPLSLGVVSTINPTLAKPLACNEIVELLLEPNLHQSDVVGFSHLSQTDYIRVIDGELIVVILHNRQLHYFPLNKSNNQQLVIVPRTWHALLNVSDCTCHLYNASVRNKSLHPNDYRPIKLNSFKYDWSIAKTALNTHTVCS